MDVPEDIWGYLLVRSECEVAVDSRDEDAPRGNKFFASDGLSLDDIWSQNFRVLSSEWQWQLQVMDVVSDSTGHARIGPSLDSVTFFVRLDGAEYSLTFHRTSGFPDTAPEIESTLTFAFNYSWGEGSTLCSAYHEYLEICSRFDMALLEWFDIENPFKIEDWKIWEQDPNCAQVEIHVSPSREGNSDEEFDITLVLDWTEPRSFPRLIKSSNPLWLKGISCDNWEAENPFAVNLLNLSNIHC